jgi:23S rRNA pseudouridine1911/1915/1917 synthase
MAEEEDYNTEDDSDDALFEHHRITVDKNQALLRIDKFLMARLPNVTRSKIQNGIAEGFISVNEKPVKSNYKIRPADVIVISLPTPPRDTEVLPEKIPLEILYEDEQLLIVNK